MNEQWKKTIEEDIKNNKIMAYIRGTPDQPRCGFTARVVRTLKELGQPFQTRDMDSDPALWQTLAEINNWPTSPQIFVNGEFIGGCDITVEMYKNGDLQKMLDAAKS